jgi:hypothetical protein
MTNIIFVMPNTYPQDYRSYADYFELARLSGFPIRYERDMDITNSDHCYIVTWFSVQHAGWHGARARIILWNLEWASQLQSLDGVVWAERDKPIPGVTTTWSPDAGFAAKNGWQYVPVASHPDLVYRHEDAPWEFQWDVTLQMYRDPARRRKPIDRLLEIGIRIAPDGWQDVRHRSYMHSKAQLHIHQHDSMNVVSPLRFAVAAAYRKPIISEHIEQSGIFQHILFQSTYYGILDTVQRWVHPRHDGTLRTGGELLHELLCVKNTFESIVKANV